MELDLSMTLFNQNQHGDCVIGKTSFMEMSRPTQIFEQWHQPRVPEGGVLSLHSQGQQPHAEACIRPNF